MPLTSALSGTAPGPPLTLAYAATLTPDASQSSLFYIPATGALTLNAPSSAVDGQRVEAVVLASGAQRGLTIAGVTLTQGLALSVTIPSGKRWFGAFQYVEAASATFLIAGALQS